MPVTTTNDRIVNALPSPKTVLIGDPQAIYSQGLEAIIRTLPGFELIGTLKCFEELINKTAEAKPDLILLHAHLLESAPERIKWVLSAHPDARIIVEVDAEEVGFCLGVILQGAMGVIPRQVDPAILSDCIEHVASGSHWNDHQVGEWIILDWLRRSPKPSSKSTARPHFSPRETQIATLLIQMQHNKDIGDAIGITEQSVKNTLSRMYRKVGISKDEDASKREQLRTHCIERGLLPSPQQTQHHSPHITSTPLASAPTSYNSAAAD
ncbi:MAG TPA: response regulator transcription factor [Candidatus Binatia bacterium]|jgi:DNA-binding NarL/FixJ family response regulator|nr:response regulator transcription factor [Candidatus Binatia bacterium]